MAWRIAGRHVLLIRGIQETFFLACRKHSRVQTVRVELTKCRSAARQCGCAHCGPYPKSMSKKDPTMQDVADAAGVSRMTVSLALRHHPSIPKSTADRIAAVASRLGYRPNPLVSALMAQMRRTHKSKAGAEIAYILEGRTWQSNPTNSRYYAGAKSRAEQLGFSLTLFDLHRQPVSDPRLQKILWARNIQAVIVAPHFNRTRMDLDWSLLSPVAISYSLPEHPMNRISTDHFHNAVSATKEAIRSGSQRLALAITVTIDQGAAQSVTGGFRLVTGDCKSKITILEYLPRRLREEQFIRWLRRNKPDTVIGIGEGLERVLIEESARSGQTYTLLRLDLQDEDAVGGINQNSFMVGSAAVDNVVAQVNANVRGLSSYPKSILIAGTWKDEPLHVIGPKATSGKRRRKAGS